MHLNCHTSYPRLAVNYFRKKLHHRGELQNTGVILLILYYMQLFIIIVPPFRYRVSS